MVDGSFFPSSGAVNPALTIMANALRVGDRILERLGARGARAVGPGAGVMNRRGHRRPEVPAVILSAAAGLSGRLSPSPSCSRLPPRRSSRPRAGQGRGIAAEPAASPAAPAVAAQAVAMVGLTVSDMDRSVEFYTTVLDFAVETDDEVAGTAFEDLQGVFGARMRVVRLRLGEEYLQLTEYLARGGGRRRPTRAATTAGSSTWPSSSATWTGPTPGSAASGCSTPPPARSCCRPPFRRPPASARSISRSRRPSARGAPVPARQGRPQVARARDRLFLGIDHTAIVVADTEAELGFYRDVLGFRVAGESLTSAPSRNT